MIPRQAPVEHHDARPPTAPIDMIVLYNAPDTDPNAAIAAYRTMHRGTVHYLVSADGTIWQLVDEARRAGHRGHGTWRGRTGLDDRAIGIALTPPARLAAGFPVLQLASACDLCLHILARRKVSARDIVGHSDIAPDRAEDPGPGFDWEGLARNGVGLWPDGVPDLGTGGTVRDAARLRDVRTALALIGYRVAPEGPLDPALSTVLRAFQRHWRPEAVTGQADTGTLARLLAVARLCGA